ncbi:hypothetical protein HK102_005740 [Quaeritorhiza haematococci]|nr:hypothetical protein HK102_005740 [Quaeritorhiza haematococci]
MARTFLAILLALTALASAQVSLAAPTPNPDPQRPIGNNAICRSIAECLFIPNTNDPTNGQTRRPQNGRGQTKL